MNRGVLCLAAGALVALIANPSVATAQPAGNDAAVAFDGAMILIPGGSFVMGDDQGDPNETPKAARVGAFLLMPVEVTNRRFAGFVAATGHRTDAERSGGGYVWDRTWRRIPGAGPPASRPMLRPSPAHTD